MLSHWNKEKLLLKPFFYKCLHLKTKQQIELLMGSTFYKSNLQ